MKVTKKQIEVERDTYKALYEDMRSALQSAIAMHEKTNAKTWAPLEEQIFWRNLRDLVEEHAPQLGLKDVTNRLAAWEP